MIFNYKKPFTFDRAFRLMLWSLIIVFSFWIIRYLSSVLVPFFLAITAAYVVNPIVDFFQFKLRLKKRGLAVFTSLLFMCVFVWGIIFAVKPLVKSEITQGAEIIQTYSQQSIAKYSDHTWAKAFNDYLTNLQSNQEVMTWLSEQDVVSVFKKVIETLGGFANTTLALIAFVISLFLAILYFIFALLQYNEFFGKWREVVPEKYREPVKELFEDVELAMKQYFRAQLLIAIILGILFAIGFSIIGLPMAIVFGLFVGALNFIPYLGLIAILPAAALTVLHSAQTGQDLYISFLLVLSVFTIIQIIQDGFLVPKIMGKTTGLSAVVILLGLSIWGQLLGFVGLLLAIPLTSLILAYYKRIVVNRENILK
jgi:predicted PurR-regulated permease PerM